MQSRWLKRIQGESGVGRRLPADALPHRRSIRVYGSTDEGWCGVSACRRKGGDGSGVSRHVGDLMAGASSSYGARPAHRRSLTPGKPLRRLGGVTGGACAIASATPSARAPIGSVVVGPPGPCDRNHDTARGPGGPCSVAGPGNGLRPRQVRRRSQRGLSADQAQHRRPPRGNRFCRSMARMNRDTSNGTKSGISELVHQRRSAVSRVQEAYAKGS
jgi:hypothetical protein